MVFCREVDLFDSASLDKAFLWALAVERKVAPRICPPQTQSGPSTASPSIARPSIYTTFLASPSTPNNVPRCTFHKTDSHASVDCWALKIIRNNMYLFVEVAQSSSPNHHEVISLDNPIEVDLSLILMTANEPNTSNVPLFTHNCQIKHELATLIMDNGSQKNLVSQDLV